jgi:hypothetical protein
MRRLIAAILILVAAGIFAAAYLVHPSTLTPSELGQIKSNCSECHKVPMVQSASSVHAAHQTLDCETCHTSGTRTPPDFNSCIPCHSIPSYVSAAAVHDAHATTECVVCHSESAGLASASSANNTLKMVGIVLVSLVLAGIILNFCITKIRLGRRKDGNAR